MKKYKRSKEMKSMETFKKGFRKNEIVIYAIALMLVTAGYFNYTTNFQAEETVGTATINKENTTIMQDKATESVAENEAEQENKDKNIGDAQLVNSNEVKKEDEPEKVEKNITNNYFANSRLERDTNYADMISTYTKILEDSSVSETQKSIAMKEITKINNTKNAISVCENILSTKGFEDYVILVNNDSVNVVIKDKESLTKEKVAQIQNIVSRELGSEIQNIHITENK